MTIYTRNEAARIVDMFEDILCENEIKVPSPDDDQRDPDNDASLYGQTYSDLLDTVEERLIDLLNKHVKVSPVKSYCFSGGTCPHSVNGECELCPDSNRCNGTHGEQANCAYC